MGNDTHVKTLKRNGGDCGYMVIMQVDSIAETRAKLAKLGRVALDRQLVATGDVGLGLADVKVEPLHTGEAIPRAPGTVGCGTVQWHPMDFGTLMDTEELWLPHRGAQGSWPAAGNRWQQAGVAAAQGGPLCPDGRARPRREALAVAYAALVLGEAGPEGPRMLELVDPEESQNLLLAGNAAEHRREFREAAAQYAQALGSGTDEARAHLSDLGIDPARLLLGMTADTTTGAASVLPPLAMEALVVAPGRESVTVLLDRAEAGRPLTRVVALGALGQLAGSPHLTPREHAAVRRAITIATEAAEPFVREVALTTLTDLHEP